MSAKIVLGFFLATLSFAIIKGQPSMFGNLEACRSELGIALTDVPAKMSCLMGCAGKKDGWIKTDGTLDVDSKVTFATKMGMPDALVQQFKKATEACKTTAQGVTDNCQIGDKIYQCMTSNGAPFPPMPPMMRPPAK